MQKQIVVNATNARKDLFELLDKVLESDMKVVINKKGSNKKAVLTKESLISERESKRRISRNRKIVRELYGSLKSKVPYNPNEMKLAAEIYAKEYAKKHGFKLK